MYMGMSPAFLFYSAAWTGKLSVIYVQKGTDFGINQDTQNQYQLALSVLLWAAKVAFQIEIGLPILY